MWTIGRCGALQAERTPREFRIDTLLPTANGSTVTSIQAGVATAFQAVDDPLGSHNADTNYVSNSTVGNIDLFALGDLAANPATIHAIAVSVNARSDNPGLKKYQIGMKTPAGEVYSGSMRRPSQP